jgi:hypothetical protein
MDVLDNVELVRFYDCARLFLWTEAKKRKQFVVEGNGHRHVADGYLNMVDYRLHSIGSSFHARALLSCANTPIRARHPPTTALLSSRTKPRGTTTHRIAGMTSTSTGDCNPDNTP